MEDPVLHHERIIVTPHLGASTAEAQERVAVDVAEQILAILRGEPAQYAVNAPMIAAGDDERAVALHPGRGEGRVARDAARRRARWGTSRSSTWETSHRTIRRR